MLAKVYLLTKESDFDRVKADNKKVDSKNFFLLVHKTDSDSPTRFGFIISNKVSPLANLRNKTKRILHEGVRYVLVYVKPGYEVVFIAKPGAQRAYTDVLMHEVKSSFEKAGLLK